MKKLLSYFVCFCLIFSYTGTYYLLALDSLSENVPTNNISESKTVKEKGNLEVDLKLSLPIQNTLDTNMGLTLIDESNNELDISFDETNEPVRKPYKYQGQTVEVLVRKLNNEGKDLAGLDSEESMVYIGVTIYNINKGNYTLKVKGDGYKPFYASVTLDDYSKRVSLSNTTGLFEAGDVNLDNVVNESDKEILIDNFGSKDSKYDLNRDGIVNIADLNYITAILKGEKTDVSIVDTSLIINEEEVTLEGVEGSLSDLLSDEGSVSVLPAIEGEEISTENPASMSLIMEEPKLMSEIRIGALEENIPEEMEVEVELEDGSIVSIPVSYEPNESIHPFTDAPNDNTIVVKLDGQVAVKRIIIKITKTSSKNLAQIGKVDFLNNVYEEVPKVEVPKPEHLNVLLGSEEITVTFDNMPNVTGYEILVKEMKDDNVLKETTYQTTYNSFVVNDLDNYKTYNVSVRAVNGEWKSAYTNEVSVKPEPNRLPPSVDMVVVTPVSAGLDIGWKDMKDTLSYNLYYKKESDSDFTSLGPIYGTKYSLRDLEVGTTYQIYLTGNNHLGEGSPSQTVIGTTDNRKPTIYPKYKLINTSNGVGEVTNHIKDVVFTDGEMKNGDKFSLVDDDDLTYWYKNLWDAGGSYYKVGTPIIILDQEYTMKDFVVTLPDGYNHALYQAKVYYYDTDLMSGSTVKTMNASIVRKTDENGRVYYFIKCDKPITTSRIQVSLSTYAGGNVQMSEVKIYEYDSLEDDVASLFKDDLRVELNSFVTEKEIEALEKRANEIDSVSGEYHPEKETILNDLKYAREILNDTNALDVISISPKISNKNDTHLGFAMSINDYQPLGVSVRSGEQLVIYVGSTSNVMPDLVFTQYYAEANSWNQTYSVPLKKGQNIITVPTIGSMNTERGGSVYLRYPRTTGNETIKVRVSGGVKIPYLNLYEVTDESERKELIANYITELKNYVENLPNMYSLEGKEFNKKTSVLNSTEIATTLGLLSFPATAVYEAISKNSENQIENLNESMLALDEMIEYFYRQKGLSKNATVSTDKAPTSRVNIRYMRMFDGAFMYAGGLHIGIEYESTYGLISGKRYTDSEDFTGYFGWGISHEIGHQINQGKLATAEVTNNIYALLAQTANDKNSSRLEIFDFYPKIYEKVTSGTVGKAGNVFVSLGMFWQLHLAYDNELTFTDENSIYSRINKLSRSSNLSLGKDDLLVMWASDAAGENLIPFFTKWGYTISDEAKSYVLEKYEDKPSKSIWYLNDEARRYRLSGKEGMSESTKVNASFGEIDSQNKRVTLNFNVNMDNDKILGYEIIRNGEVIMFTTENTFTDIIGALNNRAVTYEVIAYDYLLNKTDSYVLDEIKVSHDGSVVKDNFNIESNYKKEDEIIDDENPEMNYDELSVNYLIDGLDSTYFNGVTKINEKDTSLPYIIIELNSRLSLSGIKYKAYIKDSVLDENTINNYEIYVSKDRENWILAKKGTFNLTEDNNYTDLVYFDKEGTTGGDQLWTYNDISYVKIVNTSGSGISGSEIDLIAPPGDNINLEKSGIGILENDYCYKVDGSIEDSCIEAGMVVFTGTYRGNPAFNAILLVDGTDDQVVYEGEQIFFAKLASDASVQEIASGTWVYAVTQEEYAKMVGKSVRAELYRVDDALTLDGQRLTSTSYKVENLPETLGYIKLD